MVSEVRRAEKMLSQTSAEIVDRGPLKKENLLFTKDGSTVIFSGRDSSRDIKERLP